MNTRQKKALYESIMKNVSKQVKHTLNEGALDLTELDLIGSAIKYPIRAAIAKANGEEFTNSAEQQNINYSGFTIDVDLDISTDTAYSKMSPVIKAQIMKNSAGFIIEGFIAQQLTSAFGGSLRKLVGDNKLSDITSFRYNPNTSLHDIDMSIDNNGNSIDFSLEIKAFKDGNTSNITLTKAQAVKLHSANANVYYILVDYSINRNSIILNHIYLFDSDDAEKLLNLDNPSRHISKSELSNAYIIF